MHDVCAVRLEGDALVVQLDAGLEELFLAHGVHVENRDKLRVIEPIEDLPGDDPLVRVRLCQVGFAWKRLGGLVSDQVIQIGICGHSHLRWPASIFRSQVSACTRAVSLLTHVLVHSAVAWAAVC